MGRGSGSPLHFDLVLSLMIAPNKKGHPIASGSSDKHKCPCPHAETCMPMRDQSTRAELNKMMGYVLLNLIDVAYPTMVNKYNYI